MQSHDNRDRKRARACTNSSVRRIVQLYHSKFFSNYGGNEKDQGLHDGSTKLWMD